MTDTYAQLPTFVDGKWAVADFHDSFISSLDDCNIQGELYLYFYAVTAAGWDAIADGVTTWLHAKKKSVAYAFIGTDHALTDPDALVQMQAAGLTVYLVMNHIGIYHPKVVRLSNASRHMVWVGSNNLTRDGLKTNVEFATLVESVGLSSELSQWEERVQASSELLTDDLLKSYRSERNAYGKKRATVGTFVWTRRKSRADATPETKFPSLPKKGDLVLEVMPLETGMEGKQMQLPKEAAIGFFGLRDEVGASKQITLRSISSGVARTLTMTIFDNRSVRLSLSELDYRDRPCLVVFRKTKATSFDFEIVSKAIHPTQYTSLLKKCVKQTRSGSRRWTVLSEK